MPVSSAFGILGWLAMILPPVLVSAWRHRPANECDTRRSERTRRGHTRAERSVMLVKEDDMQFVLVIYHGTSPLPGSAGWKALPEAEHRAVYAEYAELNKEAGITLRLPPIAPD